MKHTLAKLSPLLFTVFGFLFLAFVSVKQFMQERPLSALVVQLLAIATYVGYMAYESRISLGELAKAKSPWDKNTVELAAVVKILLLMSCLGIGNTFVPDGPYVPVAVLGFLTALAGFYVRGKSILVLGVHYGHRIRPLGDFLCEEGTYRVIRHGAYAGTFFIHLGLVLIFPNPASVALIFAWLGVVVLRIKIEDSLLLQDNRYQAYAKKTPYKMIPGIW